MSDTKIGALKWGSKYHKLKRLTPNAFLFASKCNCVVMGDTDFIFGERAKEGRRACKRCFAEGIT